LLTASALVAVLGYALACTTLVCLTLMHLVDRRINGRTGGTQLPTAAPEAVAVSE
jgi:hypothetical protein